MMRKLVVMMMVLVMFGVNVYGVVDNYEKYAEKLSIVEVFKGTDNGFELDRAPTRLEGLVMLIRLLGKEDDAKAMDLSKESYFTDVPNWGVAYTNYAFEEGLTKGIGEGVFGADQKMDAKTYHTFVLRALGYDDGAGDFSWNNANEFALEKGLLDQDFYDEIVSQEYLRGHVAKASYNALYSDVKDGSGSLLNHLVDSGDIESELAVLLKFDNSSVVIVDLDKGAEFVKIKNIGSEAVDISGWTVVSEKGNQSFVFPQGYVLEPGQVCELTSGDLAGTGDFTMADTTIWNNSSPDPAVLYNVEFAEVSRLEN